MARQLSARTIDQQGTTPRGKIRRRFWWRRKRRGWQESCLGGRWCRTCNLLVISPGNSLREAEARREDWDVWVPSIFNATKVNMPWSSSPNMCIEIRKLTYWRRGKVRVGLAASRRELLNIIFLLDLSSTIALPCQLRREPLVSLLGKSARAQYTEKENNRYLDNYIIRFLKYFRFLFLFLSI